MVLDRTGLYGNIGDHHDRLCDLDVYMVRGGKKHGNNSCDFNSDGHRVVASREEEEVEA